MRDLSRDARLLSINWATVREQMGHVALCEALARAGVGGISPWREPVQACGVKAAAKAIADAGLAVSGYCRAGLFTNNGRDGFRSALDDNRRAVDEAAELGARCLVMLAGSLLPGSRDIEAARALAKEGLAELLPYACKAGVPLALEPLHPMTAADRCVLSTLGQANDWCEELGRGLPANESGIGVAIDVYHVWWDPQLAAEIARAGRNRAILAFHVCDWLVPTRDLLLDRGMMGDGIIDIRAIRGLVEQAGYDGLVEAEIFSAANWWKRPGDEVIDTCIERFRTVV
jgi:sugar phosphate isomerase/epimerase